MDHRISKDMISSGMIPSGEKNQEDLGKTQYGTAPSPNALSDVYKKMYEKKEETLNEHHKKDADGNVIPKGRAVLDNSCDKVLKGKGMNHTGFCISHTYDPDAAYFEAMIAESEGGSTCGGDQKGAFHSVKVAHSLAGYLGFRVQGYWFRYHRLPAVPRCVSYLRFASARCFYSRGMAWG